MTGPAPPGPPAAKPRHPFHGLPKSGGRGGWFAMKHMKIGMGLGSGLLSAAVAAVLSTA